ncbi:hypothetical protein ADICYQ_2419 [Cyclobacterium qasimii M12-11B]|nr:hypothetical protein ADICYQ_2419 [Cyclobacterium qasimii M12-11B]
MPLMKSYILLILATFSFFEVRAQETLDYTTEIIPVLDKHCYSCHNTGNP